MSRRKQPKLSASQRKHLLELHDAGLHTLWVPDIRGVGPELRVRDGNQPDRMIGTWRYD